MALCKVGGWPYQTYAHRERRVAFAIVTAYYFIKWAKAKPLAKITEQKTTDIFWKFIICLCGIPHTIVIDNEKQFNNARFANFRKEFDIKKHFSTPKYPQANGQVESINKIIKHTLKAKLDALKKDGWRTPQHVVVLPYHHENQHKWNTVFPNLWRRSCNST